jgi:homoserine kinase type II
MAVYTQIDDGDLETFVTGFDIGAVQACDGIAQGIENSNFRLRTETGVYILTLYEKRVRLEDLPFYLNLMNHLAARGFPCPTPVANRQGATLHTLSGRPAAIVTFLAGDWPRESEISPAHCRDIGAAAARLHLAGADFPARRANDLSVGVWRRLYTPLAALAEDLRPAFSAWIEDELAFLEPNWPTGLPAGTVHTDMFPDNVFFKDGALSGVINSTSPAPIRWRSISPSA